MKPVWRRRILGFTIIELMIVVVIIGVLSAIGGVTLNSRMRTSRLEDAAQTLVTDVSYARGAAALKSCPTRFIFCNSKTCLDAGATTVSGNIGDVMTGGTYYAILRMSQNQPGGESQPCYNAEAVSSSLDKFQFWDFDRRPQPLPKGVKFTAIYNNGWAAANSADWQYSTNAFAANTLYFRSSDSSANVPVTGSAANGDKIAFQLQLDDCDPSANEDCGAYFVTVGSGGIVSLVRCESGGRVDNTNKCF